jgi:Leucine-rich repeat (LRR) protein
MFCRACGHVLIGVTNNRCPECGREFDPADSKSFLGRTPQPVVHRIIKLVLILFCLTLPADAYFSYLGWQVHREKAAIQFLRDHGVMVGTYDTTPRWAKVVLRGRAGRLWERADTVGMPGARYNVDEIPLLMAAVGKLKSLRFLNVYPIPITDSDLANLEGLTPLRTLMMSHTSVTNAGLVHLERLTALQGLDLRNTRVTDAGLVSLTRLTALQWLYLEGTSVTDAGLANLKGLTALQELNLESTRVADVGLMNLTALRALERLWLSHTRVTDAGLMNLTGLTGLQELYLNGTSVTNTGVAKLQKSLPKCEIVH